MARVKWDQIAEKFFEGGCSKGMCYSYNSDTKSYDYGEAWNGISGFTDNPSGADEQASYADNIKYISMKLEENDRATKVRLMKVKDMVLKDAHKFEA